AMVKFLVSKNADINANDNNGNTPLNLAVMTGNKVMIGFLVSKGAELSGDKNALLYKAALEGNKDAVDFLLSKGADINAKDRDGNTLLHRAISTGKTAVVE